MSESPATRRVTHELDRTRSELLADLNTLSAEITNAVAALRAGKPVNAHLIANAAMITAEIARWNLALELLPFTSKNSGR